MTNVKEKREEKYTKKHLILLLKSHWLMGEDDLIVCCYWNQSKKTRFSCSGHSIKKLHLNCQVDFFCPTCYLTVTLLCFTLIHFLQIYKILLISPTRKDELPASPRPRSVEPAWVMSPSGMCLGVYMCSDVPLLLRLLRTFLRCLFWSSRLLMWGPALCPRLQRLPTEISRSIFGGEAPLAFH